jgi:transposase InsO family protein
MSKAVREEKKRESTPPPRGRRRKKFSGEVKLRAVRLNLEEGYPLASIGRELGVSKDTIYLWVKRYRSEGEEGLEPRPWGSCRGERMHPAVKAKIVEVKKEHPGFGVKRIAQVLKRAFFLRASPETVRRTLKEKELLPPKRRKARRNPPQPRFFERSTPNQMWQSDIFTFRLNERNGYLIGFIDDNSRYIVGLGLFRSQKSEQVLEVYRTAVGEYGPPKEMLTDNGRQYTSWRGKTPFEKELGKDRVHHLKSRPHHPMTLGKIERFWKTIWEEFLERAKFSSFEEARERIALWVKYYNHKRPHQGIGGLCPADRFFKIQQGIKETIEKGIAENVEEMAVHGEPKSPFYLVGRLGERSVVIREEGGKVSMVVDGEEKKGELSHAIEGGKSHEPGGDEGQGGREDGRKGEEGAGGAQRQGEVRGGAGGVDGEEKAGAGVPEAGGLGGDPHELAGQSAQGYAGGPGAAEEARRLGGAADAGEAGAEARPSGGGAGSEIIEAPGTPGEDPGGQGRGESVLSGRGDEGERGDGRGEGAQASRGDHQGAGGGDDGARGGEKPLDLGQDVLQVGEAGSPGLDGSAPGAAGGEASASPGPGEGGVEAGAGSVATPGADLGGKEPDPGSAG